MEVANGLSGVEILTGGNPTPRRNKINYNLKAAVRIHQNGLSAVECMTCTAVAADTVCTVPTLSIGES